MKWWSIGGSGRPWEALGMIVRQAHAFSLAKCARHHTADSIACTLHRIEHSIAHSLIGAAGAWIGFPMGDTS